MTPAGILHFGAAIAALGSGLAVLLLPKGTQTHRLAGRLYLGAMLTLNLAAITIYEDSPGSFGVFHYLAFVSLVTLAAGFAVIRFGRGRIGARMAHGHFMAWSYVGLVAAGTRQAAALLEISVAVAILAVLAVGGTLVHLRVPATVRR